MSAEETILLLQNKSVFFRKEGTVVHISYKNGHWYRGIIKEVSADFFIIQERMKGTLPVFFAEIKDIRPFTDLKKEEKG